MLRQASPDQARVEMERDRFGKTDPLKIRVGWIQDLIPFADNYGWHRQNR
jgi:hypothetical protein